MNDSRLALTQLRRRLERLEPRRAPAQAGLLALGADGLDRALGGGLARGRVHEVFAETSEAASGAGFAALLAWRAADNRPLLWLRTETAQRETGRLHATGLGELGLDPAALLLGLVPDEPALLRAAAEATRCAGLGAMLIECRGPMRGFDLTASRRLMLAAEVSGVTVLVLRILAELRFAPSAADTRWRVSAAPSTALEAGVPGAPMFTIELLRRRAGPSAGPWRVEWDRDRSCFVEPAETSGEPALPLVIPALAAGRAVAEALRWSA
jgi:protein ImuA